MIHAAVMLCGVALPSLTMSIEGRENMSISFGIGMGEDKIDPMIRLCSEEKMFGRNCKFRIAGGGEGLLCGNIMGVGKVMSGGDK